jgi:hypothetical protein
MTKKTWRIFWDPQCPYSKKMWKSLSGIKERHDSDYNFVIYLTSLVFHPQVSLLMEPELE